MSNEQQKYLLNQKKYYRLILFTQIFIFISIIILWQYLSDKNLINTFITSSPKKILYTIIDLIRNNNLFYHIWITTKETIISFVIVSILSLFLSLVIYSNDYIYKVLDPYLIILNSMPKIALGPLIIITIGANTKGIITMAILVSIIVSIQNLLNYFINTDKSKIKLLKTFNASKIQIITNVILPSNKTNIISTFKINISMCLIGVIMGEFLSSKAGIGYLIQYGSQVFNLDLVMSGLFILLIVSYILYYLINKIN